MSKGFPIDNISIFRRTLLRWYREHARVLPWRNVSDPYRIWVSEVMLQQTRVNAVIDHYHLFLSRFPTLLSLALAPEADVLAAWSGLGYYRRARMLHRAAQFIASELNGVLPDNSDELRKLPGIGVYTSAAIASIAFGESIAVVDGNVERVILRLTGHHEDTTAAGRRFIASQADALVPPKRYAGANLPGDHNQAMMELGATICLPKAPLCLQCPVYRFCVTKGEHRTYARKPMHSRPIAYLLHTRRRSGILELQFHRRPDESSLMPGMLELPEIPASTVGDHQPMLLLRHSITSTNFYVRVYDADRELLHTLPSASADLHWFRHSQLENLPLTGLTRKILHRIHVIPVQTVHLPPVETDKKKKSKPTIPRKKSKVRK